MSVGRRKASMECQEATESMPTHHAIHEDPAHGIFIFRFWNALKLKKNICFDL
jgi:hypothetical protein